MADKREREPKRGSDHDYRVTGLYTEERAQQLSAAAAKAGFGVTLLQPGKEYGPGMSVSEGERYVIVGTQTPEQCTQFWRAVKAAEQTPTSE